MIDRSGALLCIGETMALVTPTSQIRLREAETFHLDAGGAESNVAAHAAALGRHSQWFSRLGNDEIGRRVASVIASRGVDVSSVTFDPDAPTGVYFKDPGHEVLYYRRGSAASHLCAQDASDIALHDVAIVHVSGITPALSSSAEGFVEALIDRVHASGSLVSFDVNYRPKLWECSVAGPTLVHLAKRADIVFTGRDEAFTLWGTESAEEVRETLSEVPTLIVKDGAVGATEYSETGVTFEPAEPAEVIEVVGAGDAFAGGYLAAYLSGATPRQRLREGHLRAALTLQTTTDFTAEGSYS